jgi:hypothetical protein
MKEIKKIKREKDYDDKIRYKEKIETEEEDVFKLIEELNINQIQRKILKKIYAGYKKEEIIGQENISEDQYTENLKEIKKQIQSNIKVSNNI